MRIRGNTVSVVIISRFFMVVAAIICRFRVVLNADIVVCSIVRGSGFGLQSSVIIYIIVRIIVRAVVIVTSV